MLAQVVSQDNPSCCRGRLTLGALTSRLCWSPRLPVPFRRPGGGPHALPLGVVLAVVLLANGPEGAFSWAVGVVVRGWLRSVPALQQAVVRHLPRWLLGRRGPWTLVPCHPVWVPSPSGHRGVDLPVTVPSQGVANAEVCAVVPLPVQLVQVVPAQKAPFTAKKKAGSSRSGCEPPCEP